MTTALFSEANASCKRPEGINSALLDYYRCPEQFAAFTLIGESSESDGYFRFGPETICYGRCSHGTPSDSAAGELYDAMCDISIKGGELQLPFDPVEVITNLRYERYASWRNGAHGYARFTSVMRAAYYLARPMLHRSIRKRLQRIRLRDYAKISFPAWPVDPIVERVCQNLLVLLLRAHKIQSIPFIWFWPNGAPSATIVTHDVEGERGRNFCSELMDLDESYGVRSSFQIVPEKQYHVSQEFLTEIRRRGFEVNIHDLNHDGRLFDERNQFLARAQQINEYGRLYRSAGFRSAVLYRNPDWCNALQFSYDMSVPSVGHLEAQRGGCCSVMPYFIGKILELPVTTTQDYSLFFILNQYSIDLWKRQIATILKEHGMASFIIHPDYLLKRRALNVYKALLAYLMELNSSGQTWIALPRDVNEWWRERSQMHLVYHHGKWTIEGRGKERARIGFATLAGDSLHLTVQQ